MPTFGVAKKYFHGYGLGFYCPAHTAPTCGAAGSFSLLLRGAMYHYHMSPNLYAIIRLVSLCAPGVPRGGLCLASCKTLKKS